MVASVKDVAARAGVSPSTVSNFFHRPHLVSAKNRERVDAAISELGYVPNESARQLRSGTSKTIALNLLDAWIPFYSSMSRGVEDAVREQGWTPFFGNSGRDPERERGNIEMFESHRVQGLIISPVADASEQLLRLQSKGIQCIAVSPLVEHPAIPSISFDDFRGGQLAGEHLVQIGRKRIMFIGRNQISHSANRLAGLRAAVTAALGAAADVTVLQVRALDIENGLIAATDIIGQPRATWPDAIFAANDMLALGAMTAFIRAGIRIPDDIALVGYDDDNYAAMAVVPLTTIRQPSYDMGHRAAEILLHHIAHPTAPIEHISFEGSVIIRESTFGAEAHAAPTVEKPTLRKGSARQHRPVSPLPHHDIA